MKRPRFRFSHLILGTGVLLLVEALVVRGMPSIAGVVTLVFSLIGAGMTFYVAIEAIEEVRNRTRVILFLSLIMMEFILFFAFQYGFLLFVMPQSFPTLAHDALSLVLHSTMIFIFNPLYLPGNPIGQALLLIQTLSALGLVMFVLQNIWQLRGKE